MTIYSDDITEKQIANIESVFEEMLKYYEDVLMKHNNKKSQEQLERIRQNKRALLMKANILDLALFFEQYVDPKKWSKEILENSKDYGIDLSHNSLAPVSVIPEEFVTIDWPKPNILLPTANPHLLILQDEYYKNFRPLSQINNELQKTLFNQNPNLKDPYPLEFNQGKKELDNERKKISFGKKILIGLTQFATGTLGGILSPFIGIYADKKLAELNNQPKNYGRKFLFRLFIWYANILLGPFSFIYNLAKGNYTGNIQKDATIGLLTFISSPFISSPAGLFGNIGNPKTPIDDIIEKEYFKKKGKYPPTLAKQISIGGPFIARYTEYQSKTRVSIPSENISSETTRSRQPTQAKTTLQTSYGQVMNELSSKSGRQQDKKRDDEPASTIPVSTFSYAKLSPPTTPTMRAPIPFVIESSPVNPEALNKQLKMLRSFLKYDSSYEIKKVEGIENQVKIIMKGNEAAMMANFLTDQNPNIKFTIKANNNEDIIKMLGKKEEQGGIKKFAIDNIEKVELITGNTLKPRRNLNQAELASLKQNIKNEQQKGISSKHRPTK